MQQEQRNELIRLAESRIGNSDRSHDFLHALRILHLSEKITDTEGGDLDVIIPAALFHDSVIYPKDDPRSPFAAKESAKLAKSVIEHLSWYPVENIVAVVDGI